MLIESIDTTLNPKHIECALVGAQPVVAKVVPGYPTHRESHPSLYESYYGDDNLPFPFVWHDLF